MGGTTKAALQGVGCEEEFTWRCCRALPTAVHLGPKAFALLAVTELEVTHRLRRGSSLHNKLQQLVPGRGAVALPRLLCIRPV